MADFFKKHFGISIVLLLFFILGAIYSVTTPIFEASDEVSHYPFVKHLADGNGLPVLDPENVGPWLQEGGQPPLYYLLGAIFTFWIDTSDAYEGDPPLLWRNPHVDSGVITKDGNINIVAHSEREEFPYRGTSLAVHIIRFLSVLLGTATILLTYLISLEVFPERKELAIGAAAINAFTPMFLFISGSVNNDNLVIPLCSLTLLLLIRFASCPSQFAPCSSSFLSKPVEKIGHWSLVIGHWSFLGIIIGMAILTKESALGLLPLTAFTIAYIAYRRRSFLLFLKGCLITGAIASLIAGWWYIRNLVLYGDILGLNVFLDILGRRHPKATLLQLWGERTGFAMSYWGLFGGVNVPMDFWAYRALNSMAIIAAFGLAIFIFRKLAFEERKLSFSFLILLAWPTIVFVSLIRWALLTWASQGRLVFSAISAISILLFLGLSQFAPSRYKISLVFLIGVPMFILSSVAPFRYIAPAYAKPSLLSVEEIGAIPNRLDVNFGGKMKLLGYEVERESVKPGEDLPITLYWQSLSKMEKDWSVFVHLLDENDLIIAQRDTFPGLGLYPTRLWSVGEAIADRYVLTLPETAHSPSRAKFEVGLYDFYTGERLEAFGPEGELLGDNVRFFEIEIIPHKEGGIPNPVYFNFGNKIALVGYELDKRVVKPGEAVRLTLYWRAIAEMKEDYTVFTHVLGEGNRIWAQKDSWPKDGASPTSTWVVGELVIDDYELVLNPDTPSGVYEIEVGLYLAETMERLRIIGEGGRLLEDWVILGKLRVE